MADDPNPATLQDKDRLDQLAKLADDRWREYENKSNAEWKLSFAIWGAMLAAAGTLLSSSSTIASCQLTKAQGVASAIVFSFVALFLHHEFLEWVHTRLRARRKEMTTIVRARAEILLPALLELLPKVDPEKEDTSGSIARWIQFWITVLLGILLTAIAYCVCL